MGVPLASSSQQIRFPTLPRLAFALLLLQLLLTSGAHGDLTSDTNALTIFKNAVDRYNQLPWNASVNVCQWKGIGCNGPITHRVTSIRLPGDGLFGPIPSGSLGMLTELRVLSLRSNKLSGNLPSDLANCSFMRSIYIQNNNFSGPLPLDFTRWPNLLHVDFSSNHFSGDVSPSLANLTQLRSLLLQNNSLSGTIPPLNVTSLSRFSVAYNNLSGGIPETPTFRKFSQADFLGNNLCGFPLLPCAAAPGSGTTSSAGPGSSQNKHHGKLSAGAIAGIVIGVAAFMLLLCLLCVLVCRGRKKDEATTAKDPKGFESRSIDSSTLESGSKGELSAGVGSAATVDTDRNRLVFFEGAKYPFDLEDLLRASAEVLGKGSVGTAYKAVLDMGYTVAVKRLKDVAIERRDFEQQIGNVGKLKHENLVPFIAYYYSKDEKLLVYEYMMNGSLSALLHGNKITGRTPLDWESRVRIALGVARGLHYLHEQKSYHGNIKSSNILLTTNMKPCVSDYGLAQLVSATPAANRIVGYRAPEVTDIKRVTHKADVYSYGVLLLELLTGRAPSKAAVGDEGVDLPRWVQSVVKEEWTAEVFDNELMRYPDIQEEMVQMLQIAMACVAPSPDQRPIMKQVVKMVADLKKGSEDEASNMPTNPNGKSEVVEFATDSESLS